MKHLLSSTAFIVLNKELARKVGLKGAVLLADLISKEEYFIANGMTNGWFFNTEDNIEKDTTLTPYQQRNTLKKLIEQGFLETKRIGIPAKKHFKINEDQVMKLLNNLSLIKSTTINKNKEIRIINNISIRELKFINEVSLLNYDVTLKKEFCDYWTEPNKSNTKMKWELCKTWKTELRLKTWATNQKKWDKPKTNSKSMSKLDAQINEWQKAKELL